MLKRPLTFKSITLLFFFSGFSALVFEVVWAKKLGLIFGNTTFASAAVVAAFMTGLSAGSYFFGKLIDKKPSSALAWYGFLEGGIGLFAIGFPFLILLLEPLYQSLYTQFYRNFFKLSEMRFLLAFFVLALPTFFMGGTFPLLAAYLKQIGEYSPEKIDRLYSVNLFGAAAGAGISGFFLAGALGFNNTALVAASINIAICLIIWLKNAPPGPLQKNTAFTASEAARASAPAGSSTKTLIPILALATIHGFGVFVIQIAWTRLMALVLGSSTYSFSAVLTTFLTSLGLGACALGYFNKKKMTLTPANIGWLEMAAGASVLFCIPAFEWAIFYYIRFFPVISISVWTTFLAQFLACILTIIVPAFFLGLTFPATLNYASRYENPGKTIGLLYGLNTAGSVIGSILCALYLIPHMGVHGSLRLAGMLIVVAGLALMLVASAKKNLLRNMAGSFLVLAICVTSTFYPWDKNLFASGPFIYAGGWHKFTEKGKKRFQEILNKNRDLIFYKEGLSSTVSVSEMEIPGKNGTTKIMRSLKVNGKTDASNTGDMPTQVFLGYLPLFAHPKPENVLIIGLGSGTTVDTATHFESVKRIDCVEIEPAIIEANQYFTKDNHGALLDPRVKMIIGDGRNHLAFSDKTYDVIISEPSNPWIAGISSLFTKENYESSLKRLGPDGIYCQWIHGYQMSQKDFIMLLKTFASVFPEANLFRINQGDFCIIGSRSKIVYDRERIHKALVKNPRVAQHISSYSPLGESFPEMFFMFSDRDLKAAVAKENVPLNTDDHLHLEFNAPKFLYSNTAKDIHKWLYSVPRKDFFPLFSGEGKKEWRRSYDFWLFFYTHGGNYLTAENMTPAIHFFKQALRINPKAQKPRYLLGKAYERKEDYASAMFWYGTLKTNARWNNQIKYAYQKVELKSKMLRNPFLAKDAAALNKLANLSFMSNSRKEAFGFLRKSIEADPQFPKNYADMAIFLLMIEDLPSAKAAIKNAERVAPNDPMVRRARKLVKEAADNEFNKSLFKRGYAYLEKGQAGKAKRAFKIILDKDPNNFIVLEMLANAERALGEKADSEKHRAEALKLADQYQKLAKQIKSTS